MLSLSAVQKRLAAGELTIEQLVRESFDQIAASAALNAIVYVRPEDSLQKAKRVDEALSRGVKLPLAGMTVVLKDNIAQRNWHLTCASAILGDFLCPYDATVTQRLEQAGAVMVGRANMDEFGMGSSTEHSRFGSTHNPHDFSRVSGGSSGGSAVAAAAGLCSVALGSDTGGSVRLPAAFCGVYGLKPTYGRISRYGLVAFASSLDQIGLLAAQIDDLQAAFGVIAGPDEKDETSFAPPDQSDAAAVQLPGLRVGLPREFFGPGLAPEIRAAIENLKVKLACSGAKLVEITLPHTPYAVPAYYIVANAEASSNLARFDGVRYGARTGQPESLEELYIRSRGQGFGAEVKRRIMLGTYALSSGYYEAYYSRAQKVRRLIRDDFLKAFSEVDVILTPVSPTLPFKLGEKLTDPLEMYLADVFTASASLAGIPGLSVPVGKTESGLPVGVQLLGPHFREAWLFQVAQALDTAG